VSNVENYLQQRNMAWRTYQHSPACTAIARAEALENMHGVNRRDVAKVLLLRGEPLIGRTKWLMAVLPAEKRLNLDAACQSVRQQCRFATEEEMEKKFPWISLGCLPALGGLLDVPEYIDPDLCQRQNVVFSAGGSTESVEVSLDQLMQREPRIAVGTLCAATT